jgi:hypothetical protein
MSGAGKFDQERDQGPGGNGEAELGGLINTQPPSPGRAGLIECRLCGRRYVIPEGRVHNTDEVIDLCHSGEGRSCYVSWTVYGTRQIVKVVPDA